jgi:hypothetical protein
VIDLIRHAAPDEFLLWGSSCAAAGSLLAARVAPVIAMDFNARRRVINLLAVKQLAVREVIGFVLDGARCVTIQCSIEQVPTSASDIGGSD